MIWYACTAALQAWLLVVSLDPSDLRRGERAYAFQHELNPAVALAASLAAAVAQDAIEPTLDAARLTPLSARWQPPERAARPSVLLLAVESLRSDAVGLVHQGREVMPHLSALGRDGIVFARAYAQSTHSNYSDPTVVSSLHPLRERSLHLYRRDDPWPKTLLYDALAPLGYRAAMFSSQNEAWGSMDAFYESPNLERFVDAERSGLPTRVYERDLGLAGEVRAGTLHAGILDDRVTTDLALEWLTSLRRDEPFVLVMTYQDSHFPYELDPAEPRPFQPGTIDFDAMFGSWDASHVPVVRNAYYNALHASDRQIGRVLDALRELGRSDETIVVVYGENGECFHENGCVNHAGAPWEPAIHVACVLRAAGHAPRVDDYPFALIDVAPTVLSLIGLPPHPGFQGIDALRADRPDPARRRLFFHAQTVETDGLIAGGRYKYVLDRARGREAIYDLADDPGERRNLAAAWPEVLADLRAILRDWRQGQLAYYHFPTYYRAYYPPAWWGDGPPVAR
jgi:arylsulfatase A-like enzyme